LEMKPDWMLWHSLVAISWAMGNTYLSIILNVRAYLHAVGIAYLGIILNVRASHGQWHLNWWLFFIICCFQFRCALLAIQSIYIAKKSQPLCLSTDYGCYFYWYHIIHSTFCCGSVMKIYCSLFLEICFFLLKTKTMMPVFARAVGI
jgi:hypothetical protein